MFYLVKSEVLYLANMSGGERDKKNGTCSQPNRFFVHALPKLRFYTKKILGIFLCKSLLYYCLEKYDGT